MITTLKTEITVRHIVDGFVYNELEGKGLFGLSGILTIQPEYQRNYKKCFLAQTVKQGSIR